MILGSLEASHSLHISDQFQRKQSPRNIKEGAENLRGFGSPEVIDLAGAGEDYDANLSVA